jgi:hypothetical protein
VHNFENETRDRLIDAARTDVAFLAERQTAVSDALDRLGQQAHGDADRLRGAAEQLRRRFTGAEAIPLLEAAAHQIEQPAGPEPAVHIEPSDRADTTRPRKTPW